MPAWTSRAWCSPTSRRAWRAGSCSCGSARCWGARSPADALAAPRRAALASATTRGRRQSMRTFIAALIGGIVFFIWGALTHMVLHLGDAGMKYGTPYAATLAALKQDGGQAGVYFL